MKLGFLIYGSLDTLSGGYMYDRMLVEYLCAQGDTVEIISLPWRNYAAHLTDNFTFAFPSVIARRAPFPTKQSQPLEKFDIVIQDELNHPSLIFANRRPHPYPIISLVHHLRCSELRPKWQNGIYRVVEKAYLQSVDGFIFNSETTKGVVNGLMDHEKPSVVAFPPTDRFGEAISEELVKERSRKKELRVLFLGNVIERKGLHVLLEAISLPPSAFCLDIVGSLTTDPAYARKMQEFVTANNLASRVTFHSSLNNQPLIEKLKSAHVLVVPSSYEGFGIVYLEGMGFGLPAIGTTLGAAAEVIEDGVTGFLIQPGDAQRLADQLNVLNERRDVLLKMSLAARSRYQRQPKWNQTAGQIREFLLSFL